MGSFLFGSKPKAVQQPSTAALDTAQQGVESPLATVLKNNLANPATPYGGEFAAPLSGLEKTSLAALEQQAMNQTSPTNPATGATAAAGTALTDIFNQGPQSFEDYYQTNVENPAIQDFSQKTIPAISAAFARSAGGTYGSDRAKAIGTATKDLTDSLVKARSGLAFNTQQQNTSNKIAAAGALPTLGAAGTGVINNLATILAAGGVPRSVEQTDLSGKYADFQRQQQAGAQAIAQALGFLGTPTIFPPNTVVNPGSQGFLSQAVQSLGPAAILAAFA
jgi:hypothetical protein